MSKPTFPARLRKRREAAGLSVQELAKATGLSRQSLYDMENGKFKPSLENAHKLAAALRCSVDDLGKP